MDEFIKEELNKEEENYQSLLSNVVTYPRTKGFTSEEILYIVFCMLKALS
jgi:hypothetical protein